MSRRDRKHRQWQRRSCQESTTRCYSWENSSLGHSGRKRLHRPLRDLVTAEPYGASGPSSRCQCDTDRCSYRCSTRTASVRLLPKGQQHLSPSLRVSTSPVSATSSAQQRPH